MLMIKAIIRPEKADEVMAELMLAGFPSISKMDLLGRGKQKGIQVGTNHYNQISKKLLMIVINDDEKDDVISIIMRTARTGEHGSFGDGKIFVMPVMEAFTISNGKNLL
ncbi:P-II family nitrogen regulator [Paenibacillus sp. FSL R7-0331]|uniref:P-II family nitrogen regulator n=1 Tax=Paenibacillus sp. FSL R7-0331 TaxID=1536773 RepID=UPI0004F700EB|nr:P-II family nitrogen regulator [Paenibacillus sp. FSL R7-0331]AIQ50335.1 nitrogen fixation protein NifHD [Paenibacillus sp. FSL R7-0331]